MECRLKEKQYPEVIFQTAEKLLMHSHANQFKEYQMRALSGVGKHTEVAFVGRSLIESGNTSPQVLNLHLHSLIELGEDHRFLKTLNLVYNLYDP
jgi:hypothetical protein